MNEESNGGMVVQRMVIAMLALALVSCCPARQAQVDPGGLTGTVVIIGNEPFTVPALQTADGAIHRLSCSKELERTLRSVQGKRVRLAGSRGEATMQEMHVTEVVVLTDEPTKGAP